MELQFYDVIRFFTVFQFFFFSIFLLTLKKGNQTSNKLFGLFLLSKVFCFSNELLFRFAQKVVSWTPHLFFIGESFEFLLGPLLYLYARSLAYQDFKLNKYHLLHLIPFILHIVFMSVNYHFFDADQKMHLLANGFFTRHEYIAKTFAIYFHFIIYSIVTLYILFMYKKQLKELYSSIDKIKLTWLSTIIAIFIVLWGGGLINFVSRLLGYNDFYPFDFSVLLLFIFANLILYKGLKQPEIFAGIKQKKQNDKPLLSEALSRRYSAQLKALMEKEQPYLVPAISLNDLAEKISISPRYLSYVINKSYNQNFFDFINSYRIQESKRLFSDPDNRSRTVLNVLYDVGFNSKSVFNAAFKKHAGMTPTQFKKQYEN